MRQRPSTGVGHSGGLALCDLIYFPDDHLGIVVLANQKRLYPQLASLIADLYIPCPESYRVPATPDPSPDLSTRARKLIDQIAAGTVDGELLIAAKRDSLATGLNDVGSVWLGLLDPITDFTLLKCGQTNAGQRTKSYRILFGRHAKVFAFTFDAKGLIADVTANGD